MINIKDEQCANLAEYISGAVFIAYYHIVRDLLWPKHFCLGLFIYSSNYAAYHKRGISKNLL